MTLYTKYGYQQKREHKNPKLCSMFPIPDPETFPIVKRMFELGLKGHSTSAICTMLRHEFPDKRSTVHKGTIDKRMRDSFYCGHWVVKKGTKQERMIDLNTITLMDHTRFIPAISPDDFTHLQQLRKANQSGVGIKRKRTNPLPQLVTCGVCG